MLALAAGNDKQFEGLCKCLNLAELSSDSRFRTNAARVNNREALISALEEVTMTKTASEWIAVFDNISGGDKFAYAPVNNMKQVFEDPQVLHRKMVLEVDHPTAGRIKLPGVPVKFPEFNDDSGHMAPPLLGQHTAEVLESVLKLSPAQIKQLVDDKVVFT
jgi:succinate--hydroxymethylglutarate CoA-transferase